MCDLVWIPNQTNYLKTIQENLTTTWLFSDVKF